MHHALQIQEILLNIFGHCHGPSSTRAKSTGSSDLPALARTCHTFKNPALDVLWEKLLDPSPIAQCVPEACHFRDVSKFGESEKVLTYDVSGLHVLTNFSCSSKSKYYSFGRRLTQIEWNTLRSYTSRIRCMMENTRGLDWESVATFLNPLATEPLFPNLRILQCLGSSSASQHLLYMHFPSLVHVSFAVDSWDKRNHDVFHRSLESFSKFSPHIQRICILWDPPETIVLDNVLPTCIRQWQNLQSVNCPMLALDADAIVHLSHMPALTQLCFGLTATVPDGITPSNSFISFSNLCNLELQSEFLAPISRFLCGARLPAVTDFAASIQNCPSKVELSSFWTGIRTSGIARRVQRLGLEQRIHDMYVRQDPRPVLVFEDVQPCMAFSNLRYLSLQIEWNVDMTSNQLRTFASTWPGLDTLSINTDWGWSTECGITPDDLLQLLLTCSLLSYIGLSIDTRGYTEFSQSQTLLGMTKPRKLSINVADARIQEESVKAVTTLLLGIMLRSDLRFYAWRGWGMNDTDSECVDLWYKAYNDADVIVTRLLESAGVHRPLSDW